jgi:DNA-directed RNA polymerase III subunit RPC2
MLTSGITGQSLEAYVYFGPIYYQKLKVGRVGVLVFALTHRDLCWRGVSAHGDGQDACSTDRSACEPHEAAYRGSIEGRWTPTGRDGAWLVRIIRLVVANDSLIGYGATQLLLERLMISSDAFETQVCETCGILGYNQWCPKCKTGKGIVKLTIPYAAKLLIQEVSEHTPARRGLNWRIQLMGMNIMPKLCLEDTV